MRVDGSPERPSIPSGHDHNGGDHGHPQATRRRGCPAAQARVAVIKARDDKARVKAATAIVDKPRSSGTGLPASSGRPLRPRAQPRLTASKHGEFQPSCSLPRRSGPARMQLRMSSLPASLPFLTCSRCSYYSPRPDSNTAKPVASRCAECNVGRSRSAAPTDRQRQ